MTDVVFDFSDLEAGLEKIQEVIEVVGIKSIEAITDEVMRISTQEVPLRDGYLLASLGREVEGLVTTVGYNIEYAARLHEHPEYNFRKGRKGKYLIDPITINMSVFYGYMEKTMKEALQ